MEKVILTGASEGLGFELSKLFLEKGTEVIGICRSKPFEGVKHIQADLSSKEDLNKIIEKIKKEDSEFDCLINCAGIMSVQELGKINPEEIDNLFKINILAPIKLVSGLIEEIKSNSSDIINVGSTVGFKAYEKQAAYGASKWAVRGFNENLRLELKNTKSRVIGFNPGGFKSRIFEKATGEKTNLEEYMDPKELAKLIIQILELPKNIEVSEIIVNRK